MECNSKQFTLQQAQNVWDVLGKLLSEQYGVDIKYTVREKEKDAPADQSAASITESLK